MPLNAHYGLDTLDFTPGTIRTEMSDFLMASLLMLPNLLAALPVSPYRGGGGTGVGNAVQQLLHYWEEDRLNPRTVTLLDVGGIGSGTSFFTVSNADAVSLTNGNILKDRAQSLLTAEQMQTTGMTVGATNTTVNINRGVNGTAAASHLQNAVIEIVATPVQGGSDLGFDQSRVPGIKSNIVQMSRKDVVITGAMISLAQHGMVPGIPNQLAYQLHQRFWEMLIDWERSLILGIGTPSSVASDYQTMWGVLAWLGYASPVPNATATIYNANGASISDFVFNQVGINIYLQGGEIPDAIVMHPQAIDRTSRIFRDQLRLTQAEVVRGFNVDAIRLSLGTKLVKLIMSGYMPDPTAVEGVMAFLDLDRMALIPFLDRGLFLISAPTNKDADVMSICAQMTFEFRHTGSDFGYTSQVMRNFTV